MGTSKILIDGVGIDLTQDTVAANKMLSGIKAHDSNGDSVTGNIQSWVGTQASGVKSITTNGTYDVAEFASAAVSVPVGALNAKRYEITLSTDVMNKGTALITDAFLRDMRNMPYATVLLVPNTNNLVVGDATNYIGFSLTSNKNLMDSGSALKGVSTLAGSYRGATQLAYGLNQQYGSAASSTNYGHLDIDESGALSAQVSSSYAIGAGDYTIFAFY